MERVHLSLEAAGFDLNCCDLCCESCLRAAKLKLEGNNESSPLCLEPMEQTRVVSTAQCEFQSVGGVIVSNYPFIVHVASQQESAVPPPPTQLPPPTSLSPLSPLSFISCWCVCVKSVWDQIKLEFGPRM